MADRKAGEESGSDVNEKDLIGEKKINIKRILAAVRLRRISFPKNPENLLKPISTGSLEISFP